MRYINNKINQKEAELAYKSLLKAIQIAGGQTALARICGEPVKQGHVYNWLNRDKRIPPRYAFLVEKALKGLVKHYELRPDIFRYTLSGKH